MILLGVPAILAVSSPPRGAERTDSSTVVENVTLISPERPAPLLHADVVIRGGRIAEIRSHRSTGAPPGRRIDGTGKFLVPGLIDSHVHVGHSAALDDDAVDAHPELWSAYRAQVPRAFLAFGFTSVVDLDVGPGDRQWFEATPLHPRFCSCGPGIKVAGGYEAFDVSRPSSPKFPNLVYEPQEAGHWPSGLSPGDYTPERAVERSAQNGTICVKAFVEPGFGMFHWPYLRADTLRRIRASAAKRGLVLMVHANGVESWKVALDAHPDVIAHGLWIWPGDPADSTPPASVREAVSEAARHGVHVQPTFQTVAGEHALIDPSLLDDPRLGLSLPRSVIAYLRSAAGVKSRETLLEQYRKASPPPGFEPLLQVAIERTRATFRLMLHDHVPTIFGSDTPGVEGFGNPPGLNGRLELQDWADAGASPSQILRAATLENASVLRLSRDLGTLQVGKRADMLLLREDPLASVSAYDSIETVFLNGVPIERDSLRPPD